MKSILFKTGIIVFISMNLAIMLGALDSYLRVRKEEELKTHEMARDYAVLMNNGDSSGKEEWLYDYCMRHCDDLDYLTAADRSDPEKVRKWNEGHQDTWLTFLREGVTYTPEALDAMDEEKQKRIAESWYNFNLSTGDIVAQQASEKCGDDVYFIVFDYSEGEDATGFIVTEYSKRGEKALGAALPFTPSKHPVVEKVLKTQAPVAEVEKLRYSTDGSIHLYAPYPFFVDGKLKGIVAADRTWEASRKTLIKRTLETAGRISLYMLIANILLLILLNLRVIKPIKLLQGQMKEYMTDKNSEAVSAALSGISKKNDEIAELSQNFTSLTGELSRYVDEISEITKQKATMETQLSIAAEIQESALPTVFPAFPQRSEFDLYASMSPSLMVGGDFYDFFLLDEDHLALVIADVSDKGVPSALFMMQAKTMIRTLAKAGKKAEHPDELFGKVNDGLLEQDSSMMFVTVWMGVLTISTGEMACANAGHEYPAICRTDGNAGFSLYKVPHSLPIASLEGLTFDPEDFALHSGDVLFVYTDGVMEATGENREMFGEERLIAALNEVRDRSPKEIIEHVKKRLDEFSAGSEQFDDITMLCLKYTGTV